jgi:SAM-dependent methyltransferase
LKGYCRFAIATEAWHVNAPIAAKRLAGIAHVVRASSLELPFAPETFDLLLDRHEELEPNEIGRVLRPGGILLTQQVIPEVWCELRAFFPRMTDFGPHFERYQTGLQAAGLVIRRAERYAAPEAFRELGELVYMLTIAPWTISDFDLERDLDALLAVEELLSRPEGIVLTAGHYLIEAWKGP